MSPRPTVLGSWMSVTSKEDSREIWSFAKVPKTRALVRKQLGIIGWCGLDSVLFFPSAFRIRSLRRGNAWCNSRNANELEDVKLVKVLVSFLLLIWHERPSFPYGPSFAEQLWLRLNDASLWRPIAQPSACVTGCPLTNLTKRICACKLALKEIVYCHHKPATINVNPAVHLSPSSSSSSVQLQMEFCLQMVQLRSANLWHFPPEPSFPVGGGEGKGMTKTKQWHSHTHKNTWRAPLALRQPCRCISFPCKIPFAFSQSFGTPAGRNVPRAVDYTAWRRLNICLL